MWIPERALVDMQIHGPDVLLDLSPDWQLPQDLHFLDIERYGKWQIFEVLRTASPRLGAQMRVRLRRSFEDDPKRGPASASGL